MKSVTRKRQSIIAATTLALVGLGVAVAPSANASVHGFANCNSPSVVWAFATRARAGEIRATAGTRWTASSYEMRVHANSGQSAASWSATGPGVYGGYATCR